MHSTFLLDLKDAHNVIYFDTERQDSNARLRSGESSKTRFFPDKGRYTGRQINQAEVPKT